MKRYCLAVDLVADPQLIAAYEEHHRKVWPGILRAIRNSGIEKMEIYRAGNRLCMVMETQDTFSFEAKAREDEANPEVQEWERLMWQYQQALPFARPGEKWVLMEKIFELP